MSCQSSLQLDSRFSNPVSNSQMKCPLDGQPWARPVTPKSLWSAFDDAVTAHADSAGVDIVVNNAGTVIYGTIDTVTEDDFDYLSAVNAKAPFVILKANQGSYFRPRLRIP
jgi:NAD(P)-dependent dehydrogenase (short-subunit alcohol dehydrogenase family)